MRVLISFLFITFVSLGNLEASSLVGSKESQQKQNSIADLEQLVRIKSLETLEEMKLDGSLVELPSTTRIDPRLDPTWRWTLPQTSSFLEDLGIEFINKFGHLIQVNSAVRTFHRQLELQKINVNAAPADGDRMSSHLTGATVDIAKLNLSKAELAWVREFLLREEEKGTIEATEEKLESCFHIMVFRSYLSNKLTSTE